MTEQTSERRNAHRARTLRGGKILINDKGSVFDCTVRNLSAEGACLQVANTFGIPPTFELRIDNEPVRRCTLMWQAGNRIGVSFDPAAAQRHASPAQATTDPNHPAFDGAHDLVRGELLRLRSALDQVKVGVVLLDRELRATFINRAFRRMWQLPDAKADANPAFVALMYHGCDTLAYEMPDSELDHYVEERVAELKAGRKTQRDIRMRNGEVLRLQATVLPDGGRMLTYMYVTDIVRHADELEMLRAALDNVQQGVILLDPFLNAQFMNHTVRELLGVSEERAERKPSYAEICRSARTKGVYGAPERDLEDFVGERIARVKQGDPTPVAMRLSDGRTVHSQCAVLPDNGRMLIYTNVTDLVRNAEELERLATTDSLTLCHNRRQFWALAEAEWSRFQRYHRPMSMMMFDVDHFKWINDRHGHEAGDRVLARIGEVCRAVKRTSDAVGRLGGDEFAMLLPETDIAQAMIVAQRLREAMQAGDITIDGEPVVAQLSIGIAQATPSHSGAMALLKAADDALYAAKKAGRNQIAVATAPEAPLQAAAE